MIYDKIVETLILIGVWLEVWLFWKFATLRQKEHIKRTVRDFIRSLQRR
jgi:hypothetical protein